MDDEILLRRYAREGDETAFRALARRYGGLVYAACLRDLRRADLAEDATQSVFLVLARKAGRLRVRTTLVPWLVATARLVSRGVLRADRRRPTVPLDEAVAAPDLTSDDALFQALDALSAPEREAVVLRFVQGMSLAEVGRAQGVSEDAARMRVQRALKRLRTEYVPALAAPLSLDTRLATLALPKPVPLMTTLLLLIVSGLVALAVATAHRPLANHVLPEPASVSVTMRTKPEAALNPKPRSSVSNPSVPTLEGPFTLVYRVTFRDVRPKGEKDTDLEKERAEDQKNVDADLLSQDNADRMLAQRRTQLFSTLSSTMTLSYDGRILLFEQSPRLDGAGPLDILVDGRRTDELFGNPRALCMREPGVTTHYADAIPLVGPSLPFFPVAQGEQVAMVNAMPLIGREGNRIQYIPGRIKKAADGQVERIEVPMLFDYALSRPTRMHGLPVAGTIVLTRRSGDGGPRPGTAEQRFDYVLQSAKPEALPQERFLPETYLQDGQPFQVNGTNNMPQKSFDYHKGAGTLDAQIEAAPKRS